MRKNHEFETGDIVKDTLGEYTCVIRNIDKDYVKLSRFDRIDRWYVQEPRYLKR